LYYFDGRSVYSLPELNSDRNELGASFFPYTVRGDVNADGELTTADLVLLQKWLLAIPSTELKNWQAADLCKDGRLDTFDLVLMRKELLYN
jgi:hypothetical protein